MLLNLCRLTFLLVGLAFHPSQATPSSQTRSFGQAEIPAALQSWVGWVKYQQEFRDCPSLENSVSGSKQAHVCAWPGQLSLQVADSGAIFEQTWQVYDQTEVALPGDAGYWPQQVLVNHKPGVVLNQKGRPALQLEKGIYRISGILPWVSRPESLRLPDSVALLDLSIDQQPVAFPEINNGLLWLGSMKTTSQVEKDHLKFWVNRLVKDGHPMQMTVALKMEVAGRAREQEIGRFAPEQYQLMFIDSPLNSRVDSQGNLWIQLKPGEHQIFLTFKLLGHPAQIHAAQSGSHWPDQEIWVYQGAPELRSTQIEGVAAVDSEQGFVEDWRHLPHYRVERNGHLQIVERQRGLSHDFDSLQLERELWLGFDHQSYYFFDQISGQKSRDWRLNTLQNYRLNQLSNHGKERLITLDEQQRTGAEVRTPLLNVRASGEVSFDQMQQASGWDMTFSQASVQLNIPPGRKLITISGADNSYGDWLGRWQLIDLFFVLLTLALVFKVFGVLAAGLAMICLVLGYHEANMPLFAWFNLVVALSLASRLTSARLSRALNYYKLLSLMALLLGLLPFVTDQIRFSLYPQLEMDRSLDQYTSYAYRRAPSAPEINLQMDGSVSEEMSQQQRIKPMKPTSSSMQSDQAEKVALTGSRIKRSELDSSYDQNAVVQAGKGRPDWQWQQAGYSWNGPVHGADPLSLTLLGEGWVAFFRINLVIVSVLWLLVMLLNTSHSGHSQTNRGASHLLRLKPGDFAKIWQNWSGLVGKLSCLALVFGAASLSLIPSTSQASDFPSEAMLQALRDRLYPPVQCEPDCVTLAKAELKVDTTSLEFHLHYLSAQPQKMVALPDSVDWQLEQITLNQQPVQQLWKNQNVAWLALPQGASQVVLRARLKDKSDINIHFSELPLQFSHQLSGWDLSGVSQGRLLKNTIRLNQRVSSLDHPANAKSATIGKEQSISPLFFMTRRFTFANQWSLHTELARRAPRRGAMTINIPLLDFEVPFEQTQQIENRQMKVVLANDQHHFDWSSSLAGQAEFELTALDSHAIDESWEIRVYPSWHINVGGVPAVSPSGQDADDLWIYQYFPLPGEKLHFSLIKPPSAQGSSVAISQIAQEFEISQRKTNNQIKLTYKATRAEKLELGIGEQVVKQVHHDGNALHMGPSAGRLLIDLLPGEHQLAILLESNLPLENRIELPGPGINFDYANLTTQVTLPDSRWLIGARGPGYGPAIIYWGELLVFALLAIALGKLPFSPLNYWQWLILGLGMSSFSWPAMAIVAAWLLASQWQRQKATPETLLSPLSSWMLLVSTLVAVLTLIAAVPSGLLQTPDMGVVGNGSHGNALRWFLDTGETDLAQVTLFSLPLWFYKGLMLVWSTWLSFSLIRWLTWIFKDLGRARFRAEKARDSKGDKGDKGGKGEKSSKPAEDDLSRKP